MEIEKLLTVLNRINWNYGKGSIVSVTIENHPSSGPYYCGTVTRSFPYSNNDTRKFTITEGKVKFLGHVKIVK